jgi:hypothetical protein
MSPRNLAAFAAGLALAGTLLASAPAGAAGPTPEARAAIDAARAELRTDRDALVSAALELTTDEAAKFWPLYHEYAAKRTALGDELLAIIVAYADVYPNVGDAAAKDLVARSLKWDRKAVDLRNEYTGKIGKVLPSAKVMRYLQVERRVDTLINLQLMSVIPVVEPAAK